MDGWIAPKNNVFLIKYPHFVKIERRIATGQQQAQPDQKTKKHGFIFQYRA
jgi:hypothetical protein